MNVLKGSEQSYISPKEGAENDALERFRPLVLAAANVARCIVSRHGAILCAVVVFRDRVLHDHLGDGHVEADSHRVGIHDGQEAHDW